MRAEGGFTLLELVMVLVLTGLLAGAFYSKISANASMQLQASRDQLLSAFSSAQQLAITQAFPVLFTTTPANTIDIRQDINGDDVFSASESVSVDGVTYPLTLLSSQTLTSTRFRFSDRIGRTQAGSIILSQASASVTITVSAMGVPQ